MTQEELNNRNWISVEDELPPIGEISIICILLDGMPYVLAISIKDQSDIDALGVTHWMPLPQPPKKGDEQ